MAANTPAYWKNGDEYDLPLNGATYGEEINLNSGGQANSIYVH